MVGHKSTVIRELEIGERLEAAVIENLDTGRTQRVEADGIFVFMGQKPNTEEFADLLRLDDQGYIIAGQGMETDIPGVYAAGDVIQKQFRQITTAVSDGTIAALSAEQYIRNRPEVRG